MTQEYMGKFVREFCSGSTRIRFNDAYYKKRAKEETDEIWFRFSKAVYEIQKFELEKNKQNR